MGDCFDLYVVADVTSVQSEVHLSLPLFGGLKVKELVEVRCVSNPMQTYIDIFDVQNYIHVI